MIKYEKDYCFVIGEQYSDFNFNMSLLDEYVTIGCNYSIDFYEPTIYIAGSHTMLKYIIDNGKINTKTRYYLSPSSLMSNLLQKQKNTCGENNIDYCKKLDEIVKNNDNVYLIKNMKRFELTKNINDFDELTIKKNLEYCNKYKNVIPLIVLKYTKKNNFRYVFLLCCNVNKYFEKNKTDILNGMKMRNKTSNKMFVINSSIEQGESLDDIICYDIIKFKSYCEKNNINEFDIIEKYVCFCKIDILCEYDKSSIIDIFLSELEKIVDNKDIIDYTVFKEVIKCMKIENCQ